ncbi:hypothetical protein [Coleofasciculus sp.]|uniref:hypothetical protein n=1 Tax=Coleofasciculus sp. TaxID=3100458 RepID=UPI003A21E4FA
MRDYGDAPDIGSSILALLFVIRLMSFVLRHWSLVIGHLVGAGLVTSGCNRKDSSETRPYTIFPIFPI